MDIENYISSGIIESYVLGLLTFEEECEVNHHATLYPQIAQAIVDAEQKIEMLSLRNAIKPPTDIWNKIQKELL